MIASLPQAIYEEKWMPIAEYDCTVSGWTLNNRNKGAASKTFQFGQAQGGR